MLSRFMAARYGPVCSFGLIVLIFVMTGIVIVQSSRVGATTSNGFGLALAATGVQVEPDRTLIEATLWRCGCEPRSLAAAGVASGNAVEAVLQDAIDWFEIEGANLRQSRAGVANTRIATARMARSIRRGGTEFDAEDIQTARTAQANAEQTHQALLENLCAEAFSTLSIAQIVDMGHVAAARMSTLPPEYLVGEMSEADRVTVERCLRIDAQRRSEGDQGVLTSIEQTTEFIAALSSRQVNGTTVTTAWDQFWQPE